MLSHNSYKVLNSNWLVAQKYNEKNSKNGKRKQTKVLQQ